LRERREKGKGAKVSRSRGDPDHQGRAPLECRNSSTTSHLVLLRQAEGEVSKVEDGKVLLEQDGAVDLDALPLVALHAAEAGVLADASILDVGAVEMGDEAIVSDRHAERRDVGVARVDVAASRSVHGRAFDLGVVSLGDVVVDHHEGGAGVGNGGAGAGV